MTTVCSRSPSLFVLAMLTFVTTEGFGAPLASVLNETVKTFGSSVWVAVQANGNLCSLGLVQRAEGGGVCNGTVTELAAAAR